MENAVSGPRALLSRPLRRLLRWIDPPATIEQQLGAALSSVMPLSSFATVVDVGANEGQAARRFLGLMEHANVYSLEPDARPFAVLSQYAASERRLRCFQLAVGEEPGTLELRTNKESVTNSFLPPVAGAAAGAHVAEMMTQVRSEAVRVTTLPAFCDEQRIERIDLLKLDTQGFEERILRGCRDWLSPGRVRAVLTEALFADLYVSQARFDHVYAILRERGYKLHSFHEVEATSRGGWLWADALFVASSEAST